MPKTGRNTESPELILESINKNPNKLVYTPAEIADIFVVTEKTVRSWLRSGKLKGTKLADYLWRVRLQDLHEFVANAIK